MTNLKQNLINRPKKKKKVPKARIINYFQQFLFLNIEKKRLVIVWFLLILGILGLILRLYYLQVLTKDSLQKAALAQQIIFQEKKIPRRPIVDLKNNILATDRRVYTLYVHPKMFKLNEKEIAAKLAFILENETEEKLLKYFKQRDTGVLISKNISESNSRKIQDLRLDGVDLFPERNRFYPQEEMVAELVGYLDKEYKGVAGIEYSHREILERPVSDLEIRRAGNGMILPAQMPDKLLSADDLRLQMTINLPLQRANRAILKQTLSKYKAKRGAIIVMDVTDGSILSLTCEPTYNPNQYYDYDIELFKNWVVSDTYEPGSTFKPINLVLALDAGVIKPNSRIYDPGMIKLDGWRISNFNYNPKDAKYKSVIEILEKSSNIGMVEIMRKIEPREYYKKLRTLGISKRVGIDLPGDAPGHLKNEIEFTVKAIESATAAFGQGISLTPLKLLQLHGAIANGGFLVSPHLLKGLVDAEGNYHWQKKYKNRPVFSEKSSKAVLSMMETVVANGTGRGAKIPGYRIAGKTGTSQKASPRGGYLPNAKITSFVSIFPVEAPRYAILGIIDEPKGEQTLGGTVAAPMVKLVMESLIALQGIPPSSNPDLSK